jgi:hypothetical protein
MQYIRLTKLSSTRHDGDTAARPSNHALALPDLPVLATGYSVDGWLVAEPQIGRSVFVWRLVRNGHVVPGLFSTSAVTEIVPGCGFSTRNSHYLYLPLSPVRWPRFDHLAPAEAEDFRAWLLLHSSAQTPASPADGIHFHPADYLAWKFPPLQS